jgi:hypothetical protein
MTRVNACVCAREHQCAATPRAKKVVKNPECIASPRIATQRTARRSDALWSNALTNILRWWSLYAREDNQHLLRSGYSARSAAELPVLTRWFPEDKVEIPEAAFLDIILYSREQLELERSAMAAKQERRGVGWLGGCTRAV